MMMQYIFFVSFKLTSEQTVNICKTVKKKFSRVLIPSSLHPLIIHLYAIGEVAVCAHCAVHLNMSTLSLFVCNVFRQCQLIFHPIDWQIMLCIIYCVYKIRKKTQKFHSHRKISCGSKGLHLLILQSARERERAKTLKNLMFRNKYF